MATRTVSNTGGNWSATAAWVGGVVPIAGDAVNFTATSGNLTVNVSTANLIGITFATYVGTITFNNNINTSGTVNLGTGGYTQAGASGLNLIGTTTLTSGGVTWSRTLTFAGTSITYTLSANWTNTGTVTFGGTTATTINGNTLNIGGNLTSTTTAIVSGTTVINFNGTGTWSNSSTGVIRNNLTVNTAGTLTISGTVYYNTGILTYTAGTVVTTGSTLNIIASTTLNTNGISWNNISTSNSLTITLGSNLTLTGTLTVGTVGVATLSFVLGGFNIISSSGNLSVANSNTFTVPQNLIFTNVILDAATILNGNQISILGNLTKNTTSTTTGTTTLVLAGTGTWSNGSTGAIRNNLTINTAGTITISGIVYYDTGTLTYTAGTLVTVGSTLNIGAATTLNTNGIIWNNITTTFTGALTLGSNLTLTGTLTVSGSTLSFTLGGNSLISINANLHLANGAFTMPANQTFKTLSNITAGTIIGNTLTLTENITLNASFNGSTNIVYAGTGSWTTTGSSSLNNNFTINTAGTLTILGNAFKNAGVLAYIAGTVVTTGSTLNIGASNTLTTNGIIWNNITCTLTGALTLGSNLTLTGTFTVSGGNVSIIAGVNSFITNNANLVVNGAPFYLPANQTFKSLTTIGAPLIQNNTLTITENLNINSSVSGSASIVYAGTGTWTASGVSSIGNTLTINTAGTLTISGTVYKQSGIFTYTAGTIIDTTGTVAVGSVTLDISGFTFRKLLVNQVITLNSNINATTFGTWGANNTSFTLGGRTLNFTHLELGNLGITTLPTAWVCQDIEFTNISSGVLSGNSITINGNILQSGSGIYSGTTSFTYTGTGSWTASSTGYFSNSFTINTAGTLTFISASIGGGIFTYTAGTIITTGSTLTIRATSTTMNHGNIVWHDVTIGTPGSNTVNLNNKLVCLGTLTLGVTINIFSGTDGTFDTYMLVLRTDGASNPRTTTLVSTKTYRVRQSLVCTLASNAFRVLLSSSIATSQAIFTVDPGATIDVGFVNATDINSSLGKKIYSYKGIFSNTLNWELLPTDPLTERVSVFIN